jgi:hypothetical protein
MDEEPDDYIPEKILDQRFIGSLIQFRVKWKGFGEDLSSWENLSTLKDYFHLILAFEWNQRKRKMDIPRRRHSEGGDDTVGAPEGVPLEGGNSTRSEPSVLGVNGNESMAHFEDPFMSKPTEPKKRRMSEATGSCHRPSIPPPVPPPPLPPQSVSEPGVNGLNGVQIKQEKMDETEAGNGMGASLGLVRIKQEPGTYSVKEEGMDTVFGGITIKKEPIDYPAIPVKKKGFERGLEPQAILGRTAFRGQRFFLMKWKGSDDKDLVKEKEAIERCLHLVLEYYERITVYPSNE